MEIIRNDPERPEAIDAQSPCEVRQYQYEGRKIIGFFPIDGRAPLFLGIAVINVQDPRGQVAQVPQEFPIPGAATVAEAYIQWETKAKEAVEMFKKNMEEQTIRQKLTQGIQPGGMPPTNGRMR